VKIIPPMDAASVDPREVSTSRRWLCRMDAAAAGARSVLMPPGLAGGLPAETAIRPTTTQIYEGTNQIQRMVKARQLLKG
jgi:alkylation response protein AidB-like acyl-CoA dehydrogenase